MQGSNFLLKQQAVWPPGSADMVCPRPPLMTQVQHVVSQLTSNFFGDKTLDLESDLRKLGSFAVPH